MLALTEDPCGGLIKLFAEDSWSRRLQEHPANPERRLAGVRHRGFDAEAGTANLLLGMPFAMEKGPCDP
jgi:hypothetical protein